MVMSSVIPFRQILAIGLLSMLVAGAALADSPIAAVNTEHGLAVKGYDPVAYFTTGKPTPGLAQFSTTYKGVTYRFASAENRNRFIAAPEKFVPQYGGYCAYAISLNRIADIEPDEWAIVNDKLYLNNGFLAQSLWSLDKSGNMCAATATGRWSQSWETHKRQLPPSGPLSRGSEGMPLTAPQNCQLTKPAL